MLLRLRWPEFAYGDVGQPPQIPGNSFLVYDLTLTKIEDPRYVVQSRFNLVGARRSTIFPKSARSQIRVE